MKKAIAPVALWFLLSMCGTAGLDEGAESPTAQPSNGPAQQRAEFVDLTGLPSDLAGKWEVDRIEDVFGHAREFDPSEMIGQAIDVNSASVSWPQGFLWLDGEGCPNPAYTIRRIDPDSLHGSAAQGTLQYHGLKEMRESEVVFLIIECPEIGGPHLELTAGDELGYYYDGYYLFLQRAG